MLIGSTLLTVSYCTMSMVLISHYSQPSSVNSTYLHTNTPPQSPRICEIAKDIRGRNERIDFTLFFPTQGSLSNIFRATRNSTLGQSERKNFIASNCSRWFCIISMFIRFEAALYHFHKSSLVTPHLPTNPRQHIIYPPGQPILN